MSKQRSIVKLALAALVICFGVFLAAGQPPAKNDDTDPTQKIRRVRVEPDDVLKRWAAAEVPYIISDAERKAYAKLKTNEERENFITSFWRNRNPNPDSEENEYREAYYERIAYANEHFSSGIPGWKTDRGRIYITWGKPDSVDSSPSGGSYDKPSYEGGGSATTFPFETWFYRHLDGVGDGIEIEFVDQTGSGEYRLARDFNEKYLTIGPPRPVDMSNANYVREQDNPFIVQERLKNLYTPPPVKYAEIDASLAGTPSIDKNPLAFDLGIGFFRLSDDRVITTFTVQTENKELKFDTNGGSETSHINILGRLTSVAGRPVGVFEDSVTTNTTAAELASLKNQRSVYQRAVAMAPGIYKVDVMVRDVATGYKGVVSMGFTVPKYDQKNLSTSSLILASTLRAANQNDFGDRFVIGKTKLIPNLSSVYKQGQPVGVYLQVYNAGIDETTLRPKVDVEYLVMKNGGQVFSVKEDWSGLSDSSERLTLARLLPTEKLVPGDYEVKVLTKDRVGGQVIENKANFTITQ